MGKYFNRIFLLIAFLSVAFPSVAAKETYNILYIQSYAERDTWSKELNEGLEKGFQDNSMGVTIITEYLNSRFWSWRGEEEVARRICRSAAERNIDLIVVSNDEALYSLLICGDSLPFKVPVVFFGVEFPNKEMIDNYPNVTGMTAPLAYDVMLETAKSIFPNRQKAVMLAEDNVLGRKGSEMFEEQWNTFRQQNPDYELKKFDITNDAMTEILFDIQLSVTSSQSIMVVPYWGLYMPSVTKVSRAPTFTICATGLLNGVFCTVAPNMYNDARRAGDIASKILQGAPPSSIEITASSYELTFDYNQLMFFNVSKDRLPRDSIIVNEPYMEKYGTLIILFYALIIGLLILLVVRLIAVNRRELRKRMHAQTKLLIQNRLISQRNEFDNIFHSIRDGVVTYDLDLRIHFVNRAVLRMMNLPENINDAAARPYEGQQIGTMGSLYNNGEAILLPMLKRVNAEGVSLEIPENSFIQFVHNGHYFPVSGDIVPIISHGKQTGIAFTFRNISDEALQKRFFNLAVEESAIFPWQYNVEGTMFTFPAGFMSRIGIEDSTNLSREELEKRIHPEDIRESARMFDSTVEGRVSNARLTFRLRNSTHNYEWWEFRISILAGLTVGSPYSVVGVSQSIQRYKTTEEELIAARDRALQADKLKTAFLANMSHEIRTPLNAIVGFSDLLKDIHMFSEEEITQFVTTINKNCELLLALISDILDLSRVESGTMDFQFSPYYLPIIIQDIYDSQRLNMPSKVTLVMQIPDGSEKTIITDSVRLKQVLNNLINNAAKFTASGSITFGYSDDEPGYTSFYVEDTGAGISKEDLDRIFERFYKVDSFTQGAGLGLSISQTIVARLHGTISVSSEVGKGTRFTVRVPNEVK